MPAYPCAQCKNQVDVRDFTCKGCGTKKPFLCTKCGVQMSNLEVHGVDQLTFARPLFCLACGRDMERIPCRHCGADVVRNAAVEFERPSGEVILYHADCFKTTKLQEKASKGLMVFLIPFLAWIGYSYLGFYTSMPVMGAVGLPLGAAAGYFIASALGPKR